MVALSHVWSAIDQEQDARTHPEPRTDSDVV